VDQGNLLLPSKELRVIGGRRCVESEFQSLQLGPFVGDVHCIIISFQGKMGDSIAHVVRCYPVMRKRMSLEVYIPTMRIDGWRDSLKEFKLV